MTYEQLVMEVYEAASNPEYFDEIGNRICEFVNGGRAHFLLMDVEAGTEYLSGLSGDDDGFSREYNGLYLPRDFRVPRVLALPRAEFTDERAYVSPDEFNRSEVHQELLVRYGIHNIHGANLTTDGATGWFGISVRRPGEFFDAAVMRQMENLVKHLHRAYAIIKANGDLQLDRRLMVAALDNLNAAILIVRTGRPIHANPMMLELLSGGFFHLSGGELRCSDPGESRKLATLRDAGTTWPVEPVLIRDKRAAQSYAVSVRDPFPQIGRNGLVAGNQHILTVVPIAASFVPPFELVEAFGGEHGLTMREIGVVSAVLSGVPLRRYASEAGLQVDTVRKQLKSAMTRLEINSQKELVRLFERYRMAG